MMKEKLIKQKVVEMAIELMNNNVGNIELDIPLGENIVKVKVELSEVF